MKMDIGSSQSWWWESHNRPKHSKWLQENLGDVEMNVQAMLTLIEGDADSFAQRAEMYYKKRPDLLKVVEQFYRGYRALAERYDQLTGSIRQMPSAVQTQYGIASESPRSSPFGKQMTFKKQGSGLDKFKDSANSYADSNDLMSEGDGERFEVSSVDEKSVGESQDREDSSSSASSCSDGESEQSSIDQIHKLQQTLERLQDENKRLNEKSKEKQQQYRDTEKRLHGFREDYLRAQKENNTLKAGLTASEKTTNTLTEEIKVLKIEREALQRSVQELERRVSSLQEENEKLSTETREVQIQIGISQEQNKVLENEILEGEEKRKELSAALRFMSGSATCLLRKNKEVVDQVSCLLEDGKVRDRVLTEHRSEIASLVDEIHKLNSALKSSRGAVVELNVKVAELHHQIFSLREENEKQISECAEEKREAIRQLCFSMDMLNERNQWLEELVLSAKSRLNGYQKLVAERGSGWKSLFA